MRTRETDDISIEPVLSRKGTPTIKVSINGVSRMLHSQYDPEREAEGVINASVYDGNAIVVFLGLGLGYYLKEFLKRWSEAQVIVVEGIKEIYDLSVKVENIPSDENIHYLVGLSKEEVLKKITELQIKHGMPQIKVIPLNSEVTLFSKYYMPLLNRLKESEKFNLASRLHYKKFITDTLTVLLMDYDYFLTYELERALSALGHRVVKLRGDLKKDRAGNVLAKVINAISTERPDMLITVNHIGFDEDGILSSFLERIEMPVASWYVDSPRMIIKAFRNNVRENTVIFTWERGYIDTFNEMGFKNAHYLPLATDESIFRPIQMDRKTLQKWTTEVGFVGNSMVGSVDEYMVRLRKDIREIALKVASIIYKMRLTFDKAVDMIPDKERQKIEGLTDREFLEFETATVRKATFFYRLNCIEKLSEFKSVIHGDRGWKRILNNKSNYIIRPNLNYYTELPLFYNACKINFNTTSLQMPEAVNQRVFDVPACGAFLITDHQKALEELFEPGKEVITYKEPEEIPDLVRFYIEKESLKNDIAVRAYQRVLKEHTYRHRVNEIIKIMKGVFA
jgi:spore maturation protein CgeB